MNCKGYLLLIATIAFSYLAAYPQQKIIDSLKVVLQEDNINETDRLKAMLRLTRCYYEEDQDNIYEISNKTLALARLQDNNELKLKAYTYRALALEMQDSIQATFYIMDTCFQYISELGNTSAKAEALLSMAGLKNKLQDGTDILPIVFEALDIAKQTDDKKMQVRIYHFLTNTYYSPLRDTENLKKYSELAYQTAKQIDDKKEKALSYTSKGFAYRQAYIDSMHNKVYEVYLDSSIVFLRKSVDISDSSDGYIPSVINLNSLGHLLSTYTFKTYVRNDSTFYVYPDSVLKYAKIMLDKAEKANIPYFVSGAYQFLSAYESNSKRFTNAVDLLEKSMDAIKDNKDKDKHLQTRLALALSMVYQLRIVERYEEALDYMEDAYISSEKINRKKYIRNGQITEVKYRLKEHERQLQLSQKEAKRKTRLLIGSIIGAILLLGCIFLFYQMRLRNAKQKAQIKEKENEEIRLHALIKEKELQQAESDKKALALEKELEQERAERQALEISRLQTELIAGISQLDHKNETIEKIKKTIEENQHLNKGDLNDLLLTDRIADKSFEDFSDLLQKAHPSFYLKLQEKAEQKLTTLDLKYCTFIFMNFSSKEIANIMHVDPNTVRTTKYRLKQKLNLDKDEDLTIFIKRIVDQQ